MLLLLASAMRITMFPAFVTMFAFTWAPTVALERHETRYFAQSHPLLALLLADVFVRSLRGEAGDTGRHVFVPLIPMILVVAIVQNSALAPSMLNPRRSDVAETNDAAEYINDLLAGGGGFVALDTTLAVAGDIEVPPELAMGQFSYWPTLSPPDLARYKLVNHDRLLALMLSPQTEVVALSDLNLQIALLATRPEGSEVRTTDNPVFAVFPELEAEFEVARVFTRFGQYEDRLHVLKRR